MLAAHRGREVNTAGDGFLARFEASPRPGGRPPVATRISPRSRTSSGDEQALTQLARDHYADLLISRAEFLAAWQAIEARIEATHRALSERPRSSILLDVPSTEVALRTAWETWTVDRRHAVVAAVLPAVVVGPARRGKRFDPDCVIPVWRV